MAVTPFDYGRELQNMRRIAPAFDSLPIRHNFSFRFISSRLRIARVAA